MFKRLLVCSLCVFSFSVHASDWSGPYIGASLGYVQARDEGVRPLAPAWTNDVSPEGNAVEIYAGYNWKIASKAVLGLELNYSDRGGVSDYESLKNNGVFDDYYALTTRINDVISLNARLGRLFNNDQSLAYLLLGLSQADVQRTWLDDPASPTIESFSYTQTGWAAGIGVEHAYTANLSVKGEFKYSDYGDETMDVGLWGETWTQDLTEKSLSIGISYRF